MFITELDVSAAVGRAHGEVFGEIRPASTMVVVTGLVDERWKVEIEADAVVA
jgi:enamine deaminase RidA (YjgF/YER057c/UK114 family)